MLDSVIFSIALSTHIGLTGDFADIHPHIQYQLPKNYITGIFHNSDKRAGIYFGRRATYKTLDIEYGLAHGYKNWDIAPMLKVNYGNLFIAPGATKDEIGLVSGIEVKF